jgi:hypothetical protein
MSTGYLYFVLFAPGLSVHLVDIQFLNIKVLQQSHLI